VGSGLPTVRNSTCYCHYTIKVRSLLQSLDLPKTFDGLAHLTYLTTALSLYKKGALIHLLFNGQLNDMFVYLYICYTVSLLPVTCTLIFSIIYTCT